MAPSEALYNILWISLYSVVLILVVFVLINRLVAWKRNSYEKFESHKLTFLHIKVPSDNEIDIQAAEQMFSNIMGLRTGFWQGLFKGQYRISFEIVSKVTGIGFYVVVPDEIVSFIEKQINGAYPTAEIDIVNPNEIWDRGDYTALVELRLAGAPYFPIKTFDGEKNKTDPLSMITSSMSKLEEDEVLAIQYVISPASNNWRKAGESFIGSLNRKASNPEKRSMWTQSFWKQ